MANVTNLSDLINPQVMKDMVAAQLPKKIKFYSLAQVDTALAAQPGNTITIPQWTYIGDAADVAEGIAMGTVKLGKTSATATVKKAGIAVEVTDEAVLSGYGDPVGQAAAQIAASIAGKVDTDICAAYLTATLVEDKSTVALDKGVIAGAKKMFGDYMDEAKVLIIHPDKYVDLMVQDDFADSSKYGDRVLYTGEVGQIMGLRVVTSTRLPVAAGVYTSIVAAPGAVSLYMKRDIMIEGDRDILAGVNVVAGNEHFVAALNNATKVVKVLSL